MHPAAYLILQFVLTASIIGFTQPTSHLRPLGSIAQIFCVARCVPLCMPYMVRTPWAALVGGYSVTYLYHYLDVAMLSQWSFIHKAPVSGLVRASSARTPVSRSRPPANTKESLLARTIFGLHIASSFRFVGTPFEVRNTPRPLITNRRRYLCRTFGAIVTSYILLDAISSMNDPSIASKYLGVNKIPIFTRISHVTAEEMLIRMLTVLAAGIGLNCVQGGLYQILALLTVAMRVSEPEDWPPFYGDVKDVNTLAGFWNVFWHQTNARKFSSIAHYTVHKQLGLARGTPFARYLRIFIAFLSSGVMHLLDDLASGVQLQSSGAMQFFIFQVVGIVLEDIAIKMYLSSWLTMPRAMERCFGYIWVAGWLTWTVPGYMYPMMWRTNMGLNDSTIPFTLFRGGDERVKAIACLACVGLVALVGGIGDGGSAPVTART